MTHLTESLAAMARSYPAVKQPPPTTGGRIRALPKESKAKQAAYAILKMPVARDATQRTDNYTSAVGAFAAAVLTWNVVGADKESILDLLNVIDTLRAQLDNVEATGCEELGPLTEDEVKTRAEIEGHIDATLGPIRHQLIDIFDRIVTPLAEEWSEATRTEWAQHRDSIVGWLICVSMASRTPTEE